MKLTLVVYFSVYSTCSFGEQLTDLKIDNNWKVKYDQKEWSYVYIKPLKKVSPNLFVHKKEKIRIILQRESHISQVFDYQKILENKCAEGNQYYSRKAKGHAEVVSINKRKVCYVEFKNASGESIRQYVYPEKNNNNNYDLYSYGWNSNNEKSKELVIGFLKGFL